MGTDIRVGQFSRSDIASVRQDRFHDRNSAVADVLVSNAPEAESRPQPELIQENGSRHECGH